MSEQCLVCGAVLEPRELVQARQALVDAAMNYFKAYFNWDKERDNALDTLIDACRDYDIAIVELTP